MNLLLAFSPFIAFALLERFAGVAWALTLAALVSLAIVARDVLSPARHVKLLELGSLVLFGGLAIVALASGANWPVLMVRLWVDVGLCAIVLGSVLIGRPFTLAYAKERVAPELWKTQRFERTNRTLSLVWFLAFVVLVLADLLMLYVPQVPLAVGVGITLASLVAAFRFSRWYPSRVAVSGPPEKVGEDPQ